MQKIGPVNLPPFLLREEPAKSGPLLASAGSPCYHARFTFGGH
jgi:hypothetical protein